MSAAKALQVIKLIEQLAELRGILKHRHKGEKQVTYYVMVAAALGLFSGSAVLANLLGEIQDEDYKRGEPFLSSLVVSSQTGIPGSGFFAHARKLGCKIGKDPVSEFLFWASQMNALDVTFPGEAFETAKALGITEPQVAAA